MHFLRSVILSLGLLSIHVAAEDPVKLNYQSDVARLRKIVINSLYSHKEIFLRELISNANDALEKLRITALTEKSVLDGTDSLNITIKAVKDEDGTNGRLIITDSGIGMSPQELSTNLGTLAKSGTSDFLSMAEGQDGVATGNLIGAFGLGFYSSFLVADRVQVASIPAKSAKNPEPVQHVFRSSADESSYEIFEDPRGNTLGRGTEVTLYLKPDSLEYLETDAISGLVNKHSSFSSSFPIYLFERWTEEVADEEGSNTPEVPLSSEALDAPSTPDDEEAIIEVASKNDEEKEPLLPKVKNVTKEEWSRLNAQPPLWTRDSKNISDEEYHSFYQTFFKDFSNPLAWHHFSGDSGSGVAFKAIVFLPSRLDGKFWQTLPEKRPNDIKLMVKRVFITSDLGDDSLPKWASWVKVVVDAEDLPLNVSRETLQSNRFLKQMKQMIIKRMIQLFTKISEEDPEKFEKIQEVYGSVLKLGAVEDSKNQAKLAVLTRFSTNQRNKTSLDQYVENKKQGQKQIFYLAEIGKTPEVLSQSVFIEKLHARGYEVLLLTEPIDEILVSNLRQWKGIPFQDVAKAGLQFGDEGLDPEEEKEQQKDLDESFKPLLDWLKVKAKDIVRNVVLSNRLVKSPCAIVATIDGYTANVQKILSASNSKSRESLMLANAKTLEINPRSPLIVGLLRRVEDLPTQEDEKDLEAEEELHEIASILIDGALVRSGFEVPDSHRFFSRVDRVLRRSLGVSETAPTDESVKPAPPVDASVPDTPVTGANDGGIPDDIWDKMSLEIEEMEEDAVSHDEL